MRSEIVYAAGLRIENRFLLAATAMRAVRKLHVAATRTEDTINKVFSEVAEGLPLVHRLPENISPPMIDDLVNAPGV